MQLLSNTECIWVIFCISSCGKKCDTHWHVTERYIKLVPESVVKHGQLFIIWRLVSDPAPKPYSWYWHYFGKRFIQHKMFALYNFVELGPCYKQLRRSYKMQQAKMIMHQIQIVCLHHIILFFFDHNTETFLKAFKMVCKIKIRTH